MTAYYFTFRSVTTAQRAADCLRQAFILHTLTRTPKAMATQGCGYSLRVACVRSAEAASELRQAGIAWQRIYEPGEPPREVEL